MFRAAARRDARRREFEQLTWGYLDRLVASASYRVRDRALAEDLVQETYLRAWASFSQLRDKDRVGAWLVRTLTNVISDYYRKHDRRQALLPITDLEQRYLEMIGDDSEEPFRQAVAAIEKSSLRAALEQLPDEFKTAVMLHDLDGYKYREISEIMNIPIGTVMSRITRGRRLLAALVKDHRPVSDDSAGRSDAGRANLANGHHEQ